MEVGHCMMLILKKCMRQTVRRDGSPPISTTKYSYITVLKKSYETPFAHSFHLLLGPASTGDRDPWHWVV